MLSRSSWALGVLGVALVVCAAPASGQLGDPLELLSPITAPAQALGDTLELLSPITAPAQAVIGNTVGALAGGCWSLWAMTVERPIGLKEADLGLKYMIQLPEQKMSQSPPPRGSSKPPAVTALLIENYSHPLQKQATLHIVLTYIQHIDNQEMRRPMRNLFQDGKFTFNEDL